MKKRVVLMEHEPRMMQEMAGVLKSSASFELLATYRDAESALGKSSVFRPEVFLMDVEQEESLEVLPEFRKIFPNASVLGTMKRWDADKADHALRGGARGCILKPFRAEDVLDALSLYKRRGAAKMPRIISFFSPKGRSGRTTLASILAIELSRKSGESVALIDADLQFGDLPMFFDISPEHNVVEAAHDIKLLTPITLEAYFQQVDNRIWLLGGPLRPEHAELVEAGGLIEVIRMAGNLFRYVLVDLPAGFNPISIAISEFSDTDFLMTMINSGQEIRHMSRSARLFRMWKRYGKSVYSLFTRVNPCTEERRQEIAEEYGGTVNYMLPNEYQMTAITGSGRLLKDLPTDSPLVRSIGGIAEHLISGDG